MPDDPQPAENEPATASAGDACDARDDRAEPATPAEPVTQAEPVTPAAP